jgi:hypothetical protein
LTGTLGVHQQRQRLHGGAGNGDKVSQCLVGQLAVQGRVDHHHAGIGQHQGVAICRALGHSLSADGAACARFVIHDDGLPQHALQFVGQQPGVLVERTTRREAHHDLDGLVRKGGMSQIERQGGKTPK